MDYDKYVTIGQFAKKTGMDKSYALKFVKKYNINLLKIRNPGNGSQLESCMLIEDCDRLLKIRHDLGFNSNVLVDDSNGYFYIIQLVPDLEPNRIKLGFTTDPSFRLTQHKTSAPTAIILNTWECKRDWEDVFIQLLTNNHCRNLSNEVFVVDCLGDFVQKCSELFEFISRFQKK